METPGSVSRRVTRSQSKLLDGIPRPSPTVAASSARKNRRALADVTNDSPIFGLAPGMSKLDLSPVTAFKACGTPEPLRDGEDVLRSQVKSLLQQIESNRATPLPRCQFNTFAASPGLLRMGPTPANTPADGLVSQQTPSTIESPVPETSPLVDKMTIRTLQFDSPGESREVEDDEGSNWSIAVNVSSPPRASDEAVSALKKKQPDLWARRDSFNSDKEGHESELEDDDDEDVTAVYDCDDYFEDEYYDEEEEAGDDCSELCDGVNSMSVAADKKPKFQGKHIRYQYNSDDEIESQVVVGEKSGPEVAKHTRFSYNSDDEMEAVEVVKHVQAEPQPVEVVKPVLSPSVVKLKGLPTPAGRHLRFGDN